jgi:hypothetical protein
MIYKTLICLLVMAVISCNNNATQETTGIESETPAQEWFASDTLIVWDCVAPEQRRTKIFAPASPVTIAEPLMNGINKTYSEVKLVLNHVSNDTVYVSIPSADRLTNEAGSEFPEQYFCFAAMNLLEIKGINYVSFDFKPGVHARPGIWSRNDFADWKTDSTSVK